MPNNENFYNKLNIWKMELLFIEENANMSDLLICEENEIKISDINLKICVSFFMMEHQDNHLALMEQEIVSTENKSRQEECRAKP